MTAALALFSGLVLSSNAELSLENISRVKLTRNPLQEVVSMSTLSSYEAVGSTQ
jgi:hypothetical protein